MREVQTWPASELALWAELFRERARETQAQEARARVQAMASKAARR